MRRITSPNPSSRGGEKHRLIAIVGPTASGKTGLSLKLARKFHGEIVSVDSRQIYRHMNIGTAKATKEEQRLTPHHLIDIKTPRQSYSLAHFLTNAKTAIRAIQKRGRLPILVGGTGLYVYALLNNLNIPAAKPNHGQRKQLEKFSPRKLFALLKKLDPARARNIDSQNRRRLIRAIEIAKTLNTTSPSPPREEGVGGDYALILGIQISKPSLRGNIDRRVEQMFRQGLVVEIKKLIRKYGRRKIFRETIGYREVMDLLDKKITVAEVKALVKRNTWRFQRHQYNWLKRLPVHWIKSERQAAAKIKKFLK